MSVTGDKVLVTVLVIGDKVPVTGDKVLVTGDKVLVTVSLGIRY